MNLSRMTELKLAVSRGHVDFEVNITKKIDNDKLIMKGDYVVQLFGQIGHPGRYLCRLFGRRMLIAANPIPVGRLATTRRTYRIDSKLARRLTARLVDRCRRLILQTGASLAACFRFERFGADRIFAACAVAADVFVRQRRFVASDEGHVSGVTAALVAMPASANENSSNDFEKTPPSKLRSSKSSCSSGESGSNVSTVVGA
uniref:Uncharacterized protein n=1 Tax=Romanomermis culicivorax TaxID=13658 RepID=A0A915JNB1_ROMCU